jgi:hypothetical protein
MDFSPVVRPCMPARRAFLPFPIDWVIFRLSGCSRGFCASSEVFFQGTTIVDLLAAYDMLTGGALG